MGDGVKVKYSELEPLQKALTDIITEFDEAGSRRNALQDAVGEPYGERKLHDAAHDFEGRWDDRRKALKDNCKTVQEHLDAVIKGFKDWDKQAADKFDKKGS